jgi:hypothetical protein
MVDLSSSQDLGSDNPQSRSIETSGGFARNVSILQNEIDVWDENEILFANSLPIPPHL